MNITSSMASAASNNAASQLQNTVGLHVLRKALDTQSAGALALVQAIPTPPPAPTGAVGGTVNTWA